MRTSDRRIRRLLEQSICESTREPLGPFGGTDNTRCLEASEIDGLLQHFGAAECSLPQRPHVQCLLACSIDQWEDLHIDQLLPLLRTVLASSCRSVCFLPLHIAFRRDRHWLLLCIDLACREFILVDSLPAEGTDEDEASADPLAHWQSSVRGTVQRRLAPETFEHFRWRSCCLGVQTDDYSCGVWVAVIEREWLRLEASVRREDTTAVEIGCFQSIPHPLVDRLRQTGSIADRRAQCSALLYPRVEPVQMDSSNDDHTKK